MKIEPYSLTPHAQTVILAFGILAVVVRVVQAVSDLRAGDETRLLALPLSVALPCLVTLFLLRMPPAKSREGVLLRFATALHMLLIIGAEPFALHLALGTPVVFLLVELFETRVPCSVREPLSRLVVR